MAKRKPGTPIAGALTVGAIASTDNFKLKPMPRRGTQFQPILDAMGKLKIGQSFAVPLPSGVTARELQNRLGAAKRAHPVEAPKGGKFRTTPSEDEKSLIVSCIKTED